MQIESYFTQQDDVKKIILSYLDKASHQVYVAVAWFTDKSLFNKLLLLQRKGVKIEVIITNHEFNHQSSNDYSQIERNGGFFAEIGNDERLMHMKFCVIDSDIVISGSANWSKRAFSENNEEVTIVTGNVKRTNDFVFEFERLKLLSGKIKSLQKDLDIAQSFKIFDAINALVNLGETKTAQNYVQQLKHISELDSITKNLLAEKYDIAFDEITAFRKKYTQIVDITLIEKKQLQSQINLLAIQIETMEVEKVEIDAQIHQFNHRYIIELNPLILKILKIKKKIYESLKKHGIFDDKYEKTEQEFRKSNEEYEREVENKIPDLTDEELDNIREMYRDAVKYCHPDSPKCIFEDKEKAAKWFSELNRAYKMRDTEKVRNIWNEIKLGKPTSEIENYNELDYLRAKLETLKTKYDYLSSELSQIKYSKEYRLIASLEDWDSYFEKQKELLGKEYQEVNEKFVKNEKGDSKR